MVKNTFKIILIFSLLSIFLISCQQAAPSNGAPENTTPVIEPITGGGNTAPTGPDDPIFPTPETITEPNIGDNEETVASGDWHVYEQTQWANYPLAKHSLSVQIGSGYTHLIYAIGAEGSPVTNRLVYARKDNKTYFYYRQIGVFPSSINRTATFLDGNGKMHIAFLYDDEKSLGYATNFSGTWKWYVVEKADSNESIAFPIINGSSDGATIHMMYKMGTRDIHYYQIQNNGGISAPAQDIQLKEWNEPVAGNYAYPLYSMDVDKDGYVHIVVNYKNGDVNKIKYANNRTGQYFNFEDILNYPDEIMALQFRYSNSSFDSGEKYHIVYGAKNSDGSGYVYHLFQRPGDPSWDAVKIADTTGFIYMNDVLVDRNSQLYTYFYDTSAGSNHCFIRTGDVTLVDRSDIALAEISSGNTVFDGHNTMNKVYAFKNSSTGTWSIVMSKLSGNSWIPYYLNDIF